MKMTLDNFIQLATLLYITIPTWVIWKVSTWDTVRSSDDPLITLTSITLVLLCMFWIAHTVTYHPLLHKVK